MIVILGVELYIIIGWIAVILSTLTAIPQVIKTYRTKSSNDLSLGMIVLAIIAQFSWFTYGYYDKDIILIVSAITPFILYSCLCYLYYKYKKE